MAVDPRTDEAVYEAYAAELVRFASGLVGPSDAPDVVVDAFVRLSRSPVWPMAEDRRALWFRAVVFEAKSLHRSNGRRREREARVAASVPIGAAPPDPVDPEVRDALAKLSTQQRAVIFLTYWLDLQPASVAELLAVSEGSVRKQLARARNTLREVLS